MIAVVEPTGWSHGKRVYKLPNIGKILRVPPCPLVQRLHVPVTSKFRLELGSSESVMYSGTSVKIEIE